MLSCWEYEDPSVILENQPPETRLTLIASDTLYLAVINGDSLWATINAVKYDSVTQQYDTLWTYLTGNAPDTSVHWTAIGSALETITSSRQELHWWGEDPDGYVIGYYYRWNIDSSWTFTQNESRVFYVPIQTQVDVFSFEVSAIDNDSLLDPTPATLVLPIRNSAPTIEFRYRSNPLRGDLPTDTSFTFPTRTFVWDVQDQDGIQTVTDIFYALDDTCASDTCWNRLDAASYSSITLTGISPGLHTFFLKARDIAGAESEIIHFPDTADVSTPNFWKVTPVVGDVLLVDDFDNDSYNLAKQYFQSALDSMVLDTGAEVEYSVWEIGAELPFSSVDVSANLNYFRHVIWYAGTTGRSLYSEASSSIYNFLMTGGNIFLIVSLFQDTSFTWFPIDSLFSINPEGRLFPPVRLVSQIRPELDLVTSRNISYHWIQAFENLESEPSFRSLYRLQEPEGGHYWDGTPNVCGVYQFFSPVQSGKAVLMSIPWHEGVRDFNNPTDFTYGALLEGEASVGEFIKYLLEEEF